MDRVQIVNRECIVLDASIVINLRASGYLSEIVHSLPFRCLVARYVLDVEALYINEIPDEQGDRARTTIESDHVEDAGIVVVQHDESQSIANTIVLLANAGMSGIGENITAAIAVERRCGVAMDDKRATTVLRASFPDIPILTTFDLVKHWSTFADIDTAVVGDALRLIRLRGNFRIAKGHHLYSWVSEHDCI